MQGAGCGVHGLGFGVWDLGFRVKGLEHKVWGLGFRMVQEFGVKNWVVVMGFSLRFRV